YYGYARTTEDLDIWIAVGEQNAQLLVEAVREFGFEGENLGPQIFLRFPGVVRLGRPPVKIEIATAISGVNFDRCYANHIVADFHGIPVPVISLEDLRTNKRASK